jgi:hypothetical protein
MTIHTRDPLRFTIALVQLQSGRRPQVNIEVAAKLIKEAKDRGAHFALTPEMTNIMETDRDALLAALSPEDEDPGLSALRDLARSLRLWLHVGSLAIKVSAERAANRSFLINPDGDIVARYDKIHMFDVDLPNGESYRESQTFHPGDFAVCADTPWGRLGLSICYDLRFPALYRALAEAGSSFLAVPSAFKPLVTRSLSTRGVWCSPKTEPNPGWSWPRSILRLSPRRAAALPRCSKAAASRSLLRRLRPSICMRLKKCHDLLRARLSARACVRKLVSEFGRM